MVLKLHIVLQCCEMCYYAYYQKQSSRFWRFTIFYWWQKYKLSYCWTSPIWAILSHLIWMIKVISCEKETQIIEVLLLRFLCQHIMGHVMSYKAVDNFCVTWCKGLRPADSWPAVLHSLLLGGRSMRCFTSQRWTYLSIFLIYLCHFRMIIVLLSS